MNKISRDNYEAYLLDFAEGNLSEEMQVELELFLIQHPDYNINLSEVSLLNIEASDVSFYNKHQLKKSNSDLVSDSQFVAYIENQLDEKERQAVEASCLKNKELEKELRLYQNTKTVADTNIVYPNKNALKRHNKVIWFNFSSTQYSIAASVALLLALYVFWPKQDYVGSVQQMAINHKAFIPDANSIQTNNGLVAESKIIEQGINHHINSKKEIRKSKQQNLIATNNQTQKEEKSVIENNIKNETSINENKTLVVAVNESKTTLKDNSIKTKTVVEVITENDDEVAVQQPKKKKSFWALAERALQHLNAMGVKSVNANNEASGKDNSTYALTLGKVNVTHKSN